MEIGSEFCFAEIGEENDIICNDKIAYLLSGRTAFDYVIKDIKQYLNFKTVYLPSYCCHTMIEPFLKNGVKVYFYDVAINEKGFVLDIDLNFSCDAVL